MKLDFYLRRNKVTLEQFLQIRKISSYTQLVDALQSTGIIPPEEEEVRHAFKPKKPVSKKRPASSKAAKAKSGDGSSSRRPKSRGRQRKSTSSGKTPTEKVVGPKT